MVNRVTFALLIFLLLLFSAWVTGISQQARSQVTYTEGFSALQRKPSTHLGPAVMLRGRIPETKASPTFSEVAVLQLPLGTSDRPQDGEGSEGRFLLRSVESRDPAIYRDGMLLTAVGKVTGSEVRPNGGFAYVYPIVEVIELKLWPKRSPSYSGVRFGVRVGASY